jgi:ankyrin repeat protein
VLLNRRVDLEARDAEGKTPLIVASGQLNEDALEICKILIKRGAQVSAKSSNGSTALLEAARVGNVDVARTLIQVGMANISDADSDGNTALHIAALEGHLEICELLLDELANVEASGFDGQKPLHCAAQRDSVDICQLLVRAGADVEGKDKHNKTPLHVAAECGSLEVCQYFIEECSANVEAAFMMYGSAQTVLDLAATEAMMEYLTQVVKSRSQSPRNSNRL